MEELLTKLLLNSLTTLVGAFGAYCWAKLKMTNSENAALKYGVQSLLRDRIIQAHSYYTAKGHIPLAALESIESCYKAYEVLGANGVIDTVMDNIRKLDIKDN